jgi:hypothetical protein
MSITLTPVSTVPSNGKIIITLSGAGMSLANSTNATVVFIAPSSGNPAGTAALSASSGTDYVLTVSLSSGTFPGGQAITFVIPGFTNPSAAQNEITNVAAATTLNDGTTIVGSSATGSFPAIVPQWTGQLSVARVSISAVSVGNVALFAGGCTDGKGSQHVCVTSCACSRYTMKYGRVVFCGSFLLFHNSLWYRVQCCRPVQRVNWRIFDCAAQCSSLQSCSCICWKYGPLCRRLWLQPQYIHGCVCQMKYCVQC